MSKWLDLGLTCTQISFKTQQSVSYSPMNCVFELDGRKLYLGNINAANDSSYLRKHDVGAVLSVIDTSDIKLEKSVIHLWIAAEDCEKVQLIRYFDQASNFIQDNLRHTNVLVHCYAGISRSSSLIIAYLLKCQGYSLKEALTKLKCQRPQVDPNDGFLEQLKQYEEKLKQSKTRPNSSLNKSDSKYLSLSSSVEKQSSLPKTRQSISNFNIYSNLNSSVTKTNIRNLQLTTTAVPKVKSSFLEKSCSPSNTVKAQAFKQVVNLSYLNIKIQNHITISTHKIAQERHSFRIRNLKILGNNTKKQKIKKLHGINQFQE